MIDASANVTKIEGLYLHCRKCVEEGEEQAIEVCAANDKIQIWCRTHDCNMATIDMKDNIGAMQCEACEEPSA